MKRIFTALITCLLLFTLFITPASAISATGYELPYDAYVYNNDTMPVSIPTPYIVKNTYNASDIGVENFAGISDVVYKNDRIYITDSATNRIVVTDKNFNLVGTIAGFENNGVQDTFNEPNSCFVNDTEIYITDTKNSRIVVLDVATFAFKRIVERPEIVLLEENYTYYPKDIAVDNAGRMYILAEGINQGMIRLDKNGKFTSFFGAPSVEYNVLDLVWRKIATKKQREQMEQYVPTEYSGILIDENGFLYVCSESSESTPVAKINTNGEDVLYELQGEDTKYGDVTYLTESKSTMGAIASFADVCISDKGTYTVLDSQKNKVYVYSNDGYLLYIFGATGSQKGTFYKASAIEQVGDDLIISDSIKGTITVFELTDFGVAVQQAITKYNDGDYDASHAEWERAYNYCSNYTPAISGMAKIDMATGESTKAMDDLKKVHAHKLYAKAFETWRNEAIRSGFVWAVVAIVVFGVGFVLLKKPIVNSKLYNKYINSHYYKGQKFAKYCMFHPFDGYWDLKREKRGDMKTAFTTLGMFIVCYAVRTQFSGYVVTKTISSDVNVIYSVALILLPILFWIISNWCFSTLMEGEGTFKDIFMVTCYAMKPYVVLAIPLLILSHVLTLEEAMFYTVLNTVCWIWMLGLFFFGMMVTHNYSLGKGIVTAILSIVGILIIIFLLLLVVSIVQGMYDYFYGIVKELVFRTY